MTRSAEKSPWRGGIGGENSSEWKIGRRSVYVLWFSLPAGDERRTEGVAPSRPVRLEQAGSPDENEGVTPIRR